MTSISLEPGADLDGLDVAGAVLDGQDGSSARVLECMFTGCSLDGVRLEHARIIDTTIADSRAGALHAASATWQDCAWSDVRFGAVQAFASTWTRVRVTGGKIDYLNLRDSRLDDVTFAGVVIDELDLARVRASRLRFEDCQVRRLVLGGATLKDADLRGIDALREIEGIDGLAGATISPGQLVDLAPALANHAGLRVR
ncbi:pentapeptide repeat-containing protein [Cellulomonas edaphi]|uniref:Pentapeptide repeat-containing protein n=1 Tax=Cellulomonas edaphi TaxID=3053468 RepID=A0ABT7S261_9CELL|nr:pentapeptide repeat-containing protein [Cellulomons edaphi]MDM7829711.1 pentapeptide repeat-containing protein [Cellulomons edaphi]